MREGALVRRGAKQIASSQQSRVPSRENEMSALCRSPSRFRILKTVHARLATQSGYLFSLFSLVRS